MDFSESYNFSSILPVFSPNGKYVAAATEYRLVVRDALTTQVVQIYSCIDKISHMHWCPNSNYILCGLVKRAIVQVWSVVEPEWTCKIDEGIAGVEAARWTPDGLHILLVAEFQIRITIWSLTDKTFLYLSGPKHAVKGIQFSPDGKYMAVAEVQVLMLKCSVSQTPCCSCIKIYRCHAEKSMQGSHQHVHLCQLAVGASVSCCNS